MRGIIFQKIDSKKNSSFFSAFGVSAILKIRYISSVLEVSKDSFIFTMA